MVVLDAGAPDRLGELAPNAGRAETLIVIDHHITNEGFGDISVVDGSAAATAELVFEDCFVPEANLVGTANKATRSMMRNLEIERLSLAAMSLGIARRSIEIMNRYAQERTSFGKPLSAFGQIQRYIAQSYAELQAGRSYVYQVANRLNLSSAGNRVDSDGVKLYCSTMAKNVADRAIQVLGGYGYVGEYVVERLWRDAKLLEIGGGTLEAHQKNMARDLARVERIR